jgi:predicted nucleic acid-binding protein
MSDTKAYDATRSLVKSVQDTNKAIAEAVVTSQERNLAFAQSVLENSIEVLKSHAESTRGLMHELADQAREQQFGPESFQTVVDSALAAQERNTRLAQNILENGIEVLKSQSSLTHSMMQEVGQQFQKQQEAYQALAQESIEAYRDFVFAPFTFWQKAMSTTEAATVEGLNNFQKAAEEGLENFQKASKQAVSATGKAARQAQSTQNHTTHTAQ